MEIKELISKLKAESDWIEKLQRRGLPDSAINFMVDIWTAILTKNPIVGAITEIGVSNYLNYQKKLASEKYDYYYNIINVKKIGLTKTIEILGDLDKLGLSDTTPNLVTKLQEYILENNYNNIDTIIRWMGYSVETLKAVIEMKQMVENNDLTLPNRIEKLVPVQQSLSLWCGNLSTAATQAQSQQNEEKRKQEEDYDWSVDFAKYADDYFNPYVDESLDINSIWSGIGKLDPFKPLPGIGESTIHLRDPFLPLKPGKKAKNIGSSSNYTDGAGSGFTNFASFFPKDIDTSLLPIDNDILSFIDNMLNSLNSYSDQGFLSASPADLLGSSILDYYNQFTLNSDALEIPIQYNISIDGVDQVESIGDIAAQTTEAMKLNNQAMNDYTFRLSEQFDTLNEQEKAIYSVGAALSSLNGTYLGGVSSQIITIADESRSFSDTLTDISKAGFEIGGAFMSVNDGIGKAIGSAGGFAGGISEIFTALNKDPLEGKDTSRMTPEQIELAREQGEKQKGMALMGGIQNAAGALQGLFGGETGSDMSELLGGMGGVGAGVAGILTGNPLEGIQSIISSLPSLIDGLTESTQEGYVKQLSKQGFNDTYSEGLLDKMSAVSDQKGDKSFGIKAYIEDFFKETDIDTKDEYGRMSDLLSESIGEYVAQGHTMDEAYGKFGDELEQLTSARRHSAALDYRARRCNIPIRDG